MTRRWRVAAGVALAATFAGTACVAQVDAGGIRLEDLPPGEGRDAVFYVCSSCHGLALVMAQRLSAARWDERITWMVTENGMFEPTPEFRGILVAYLASAFPEDATDRPAYVNPFGP